MARRTTKESAWTERSDREQGKGEQSKAMTTTKTEEGQKGQKMEAEDAGDERKEERQ